MRTANIAELTVQAIPELRNGSTRRPEYLMSVECAEFVNDLSLSLEGLELAELCERPRCASRWAIEQFRRH